MNITEIPFAGVRNSDPKSLAMKTYPGRSWGRLTQPLQAVRLFGLELESFTMSWYGAIRLIGDWAKDKDIPISMDVVDGGLLLIPWGQPQILNTCGTVVDMFTAQDCLVIDYKTKDKYNSEVYMYQVQFPLAEPNIVEFHYYHCVSGYTTIVGAAHEIDDVVSWDIKTQQPYMKKALRIDTTPGADATVTPEPSFPPSEPDKEPGGGMPGTTPDPKPSPDSALEKIIITGQNLRVEVDHDA